MHTDILKIAISLNDKIRNCCMDFTLQIKNVIYFRDMPQIWQPFNPRSKVLAILVSDLITEIWMASMKFN